jgi:uncharacterized DUF497 family protein
MASCAAVGGDLSCAGAVCTLLIRMSFEWDAGNVDHIARHGVTPRECEEAYQNGPMVIEHHRRMHERRRVCLGQTNTGRLLTFVVTERKGRLRFVTAYPMPQKLREIYREEDR